MSIRLLRAALLAGLVIATPAVAAVGTIDVNDDPILFWNERMVSLYTAAPPIQARGIAMANIAMHDAVNAALGKPNNS